MDLTKHQIENGMDETPRCTRDTTRKSWAEAERRRAARRAKLVAHLAFVGDTTADVNELFDCIEAGVTAAPRAIAAEWR